MQILWFSSTAMHQSSSAIGFIDSGIIGGPPQDAYNPTFYASADDKDILLKFGRLSNFGLKISLLEEGAGIGDASALKMSYAGMTKGTTALFTTMILAAHASSPATAEALLHELSDSQPEFLRRITRTIPPMLPKAYRWVGEMEEIGSFPSGSSINGKPSDQSSNSLAPSPHKSSLRYRASKGPTTGLDDDQNARGENVWGAQFWITIIDPETQNSFYACPGTGEVSWDPPTGNFVLPPSDEGEWWELCDESRGGIPYYYQTKTGETVWERPTGFVIPLGILQHKGDTPNTAFPSTNADPIVAKYECAPILNHAATMDMSPVKNRAAGKPIPVSPVVPLHPTPSTTLSTGIYPALPHDLASDILQFSESDYAKQYFSTHRSGFIFKRRIPVAQLAPLSSPLLTLKGNLNRDAVKIFKVVQHIMGDREKERGLGVRAPADYVSTVSPINSSTTSLGHSSSSSHNHVLEEERWLLGEGLTHGELRDEIYCQVMKQLSKNPNPESVFKGWQLLCVLLITFPPSKDFEMYLRSFIQTHLSHHEGRIDIMAKFSLRRLDVISKKGPRGKPPTISELETASDAAFNPSTFGESLDAIIRLQERNYPRQKVPIILPFLADGILALGGTKSEGIFRVPGDGDSVSELKLRIDRGYYNLEGADDPNVLASLMKLWLRELCEPLVPEEMYNECVTSSKDPEACVHIVKRLPTISRRVVLFVISFLQLFLDEKVQSVTKMTPANLALVMAPNILRCNSDSMSVVFTNAQYEQIFVYNLLLHLKCADIDTNYVPVHGLGAVQPSPAPRKSKSRVKPLQH
ncbi:hypothetical protein HHX47_DHR3000364 [Lentinula edodes]|nr:hypothetical protein HHX47_DHR3000364 [Lentinula edodes]